MSWRHFVFKIYSWQPQGRERFFFFSYVWCPLRQRVCESLLSLLKALKDTTRRQRPLGLFRICIDFPSFPVPCLILFSSLGLWCPSHIGFRLCFVDVEKGLHICYLSPPATSSSVKEVQELLYWENVTKGSKGSWEVFLMSSPIFLHLLSYTHIYICIWQMFLFKVGFQFVRSLNLFCSSEINKILERHRGDKSSLYSWSTICPKMKLLLIMSFVCCLFWSFSLTFTVEKFSSPTQSRYAFSSRLFCIYKSSRARHSIYVCRACLV